MHLLKKIKWNLPTFTQEVSEQESENVSVYSRDYALPCSYIVT